MPDRWDQFNRRINEEFEELKKRITITLYGSYVPDAEMQFLVRMKEYLIANNYLQTRLVVDYQSDEDPLEISKKCLQYSDVNFLIFTQNGKRLGLVRELAFIAESHLMAQKTEFCVVFDEMNGEVSAVPDLSQSDIHNSGTLRQEFCDEHELKKFLLSKSFWYVRKLKDTLLGRSDV